MMLLCYMYSVMLLFVCKQKTAYEMRIRDWSSDVCSSDLDLAARPARPEHPVPPEAADRRALDGHRLLRPRHPLAADLGGAHLAGDRPAGDRLGQVRQSVV